jgi:hypothetical protein
MTGKLSEKQDHQSNGKYVDDRSSLRGVLPCPSAAVLTPADGQGGPDLPEDICSISENGQSMALSVTRHAQISRVDLISVLTCGTDTLDIGFYVDWGLGWEERRQIFDERKSKAQGTEGNLIEVSGVRPHIFLPGGKAPNYRYHIKFAEYHCFIAISKVAAKSPNVYVSFTSVALHWELSEHELVDFVRLDVESLGGRVFAHKISRCDLYADFKIPGGLNLEFLRSHKVGRADKTSQFMDGEKLETFYVGSKGSPIQLRIYDKGKEIKKKGTEERWLLIWFIEDSEDVWRIEAQIRRPTLKQFHINTIDDFIKQKADLWKYVTADWFSLRCPDDDNSSRRTIHEFWQKVQSCIEWFGTEEGSQRRYEKKKATFMKWHLTRIVNLCISCAAILRDYDPKSSLQKIYSRTLTMLSNGEFPERVRKKSIELGIPIQIPAEAETDVNAIFRTLTQP